MRALSSLGLALLLTLLPAGRASLAQNPAENGSVGLYGAFERHAAVMLLIDPADGRILRANAAAEDFYGHPPGTLETLHIQDVNTLTTTQIQAEMDLARAQARDFFVFRHRLADGELRTVEVISSPANWSGRNVLLSIITDISDRAISSEALARQQAQLESTITEQTERIRRDARTLELIFATITLAAMLVAVFFWNSRRSIVIAEAHAHEEHERLENIVNATGIGTWEWRPATGAVIVNERFLSLLGRAPNRNRPETLGELGRLVHKDDREAMGASVVQDLRLGAPAFVHEVRVAHSNGDWIWLRIRGGVVRRSEEGRAEVVAGSIRDITERKSSDDHLFRLANYDPLTGLPNRAALLDRLRLAMHQAERSGRRIALAFIDLDDFKPVNDRYGHIVGDELLIGVGNRMLSVLRESDTLARIGGDEFVALLTDVDDESENLSLFHRILSAASEPMVVAATPIRLAASIGVTTFPQGEVLDADQLLRQADQAMYAAKRAGKNRIRSFDVDEVRVEASRREARVELERAIEQNELRLHYQPKVDMHEGRLIGVEALVRWQHPNRGLLQPGDFLPRLDGINDATLLGEWVLREGLAQCARWHDSGLACPVSVNVDVAQFRRADFTTRLGKLLGEFPDLPRGSLELEILETGALEQDVIANGAFKRCRELGVRISLDDFGTGFSSLSYLKSVPADCLKIDRSFIMSMLEDPNDLSIVKGVLGLATAFNRESVAEGVASEELGSILLRLGCRIGQGYAIARPMPGDRLRSWLESWEPPASWRQTKPLPREEHLLLYANVEMRSWSRSISRYLDGEGSRPLTLTLHMGLGSWLKGPTAASLRNEAEIHELHRLLELALTRVRELQERDGERSANLIYADLRDACDQGVAVMEQLIARGLLDAMDRRLRLVSNR